MTHRLAVGARSIAAAVLIALIASGLWAAPPETSPPAFLVHPYLQLPTPSSIRVLWETNQELPGAVEYGPTPQLGYSIRVGVPSALHEVCLHDLKPGTTYYYRVSSGNLVSDIYSFKTAPPLGTTRWRMALYGDSRSNPATHRKVVEQIAKAQVDLIVHTGDIVTNGKNHDSWRREFFEPLGPLAHSVPWVSTIGNHERDSENFFSYMALPGNERYFGFDFANAHIICLDSNGWIEQGRDSKQYQWLEEDLASKRAATWTFVVFHHPLFSAHATRPINSLRWDWAPLFLEPANRVDGVLTGHDHFYARNWRMGRVGSDPRPGVLFLTSAGGGAGLYRSKQRDYVAKEKSVHHFVLFAFDGERVTLSAIDAAGQAFDCYVLTKAATRPEEYCAYEIEELRQFLRTALATAPAVGTSGRETINIDTRLRVPTRFRVPVAGELIWAPEPGWKLKQQRIDFKLEPGQPFNIPLQAEVAPGPFARTPMLTIRFAAGKFRNRTIELYPFKLTGPERVAVPRAKTAPVIDGQLTEECWRSAMVHSLLGLPPRGGRRDRVYFLADEKWLYVAARLDDPDGRVRVQPTAEAADGGHAVLLGEHMRLVLSDGKQTWTFAVTPDQLHYAGDSRSASELHTEWKAVAGRATGAWCVEMAIPRQLISAAANVRVNLVHRRPVARGYEEYALCPAYVLGPNSDVLPDWKPGDVIDSFAQFRFE